MGITSLAGHTMELILIQLKVWPVRLGDNVPPWRACRVLIVDGSVLRRGVDSRSKQ